MTAALIVALHPGRPPYYPTISAADRPPPAARVGGVRRRLRHLTGLVRVPGNLLLLAGIAWRAARADPDGTRWRAYRLLARTAPAVASRVPGTRSRLAWGWLHGLPGTDEAAHALLTSRSRHAPAVIRLAIAAGRLPLAADLTAQLPPADPHRTALAAALLLATGGWQAAADATTAPARGQASRDIRRVHRRATTALAGPAATLTAAALPRPPADPGAPRGRAERVLHIVPNSLPWTQAGSTVRTHRIVRAQAELGLEPHVLTRWGFPVSQGHLTAGPLDLVDGIAYHRLLGSARRAVAAAAALITAHEVSVVHAVSDHRNAAFALTLRARTGVPVVYEVRGFLEDSRASRAGTGSSAGQGTIAVPPDTDDQRLTRQAETAAMLAADAVLTLGEAMRAEILARGVPPERVHLVPNGVDLDQLGIPDPEAVRRRHGIGRAEFVVGTVTTIYPHEGLGTLIAAGRLLRAEQSAGAGRLRILIVGDGPAAGELRAMAADDIAAGDVILAGRVPPDEVAGYYRALDIFTVPRTDDRVCHLVTPLKPLEAMALGVPVIGSRVGGIAEVLHDDRTGVLVAPMDPRSLADAIARLRYDEATRSRLAAAARTWVAGHRTWRAVAATDLAVYREVRGW